MMEVEKTFIFKVKWELHDVKGLDYELILLRLSLGFNASSHACRSASTATNNV